jgi:hypothetical protein
MRAARYGILIELVNQVVPQQVPVSWTSCNYGGARPWLHCLCGRRVARLFKGFGGYFCRPCCGNPVYESQTRHVIVVAAAFSAGFPSVGGVQKEQTYQNEDRRSS